MNKPFLFFILLLFNYQLIAVVPADTIKINSVIEQVTVFTNGAHVVRSGELNLKSGKSVLLADDLPYEINSQSIQVSAIENTTILFVNLKSMAAGNDLKSEKAKTAEKNIRAYEDKIRIVKSKLKALEKETDLLNENMKVGSKDYGTRVTDLKDAAQFYRSRLQEIYSEQIKIASDLELMTDTLKNYYKSLNETAADELKATSRIFLMVETASAGKRKIKWSYYVTSAGWIPHYDFRVEEINKPINIVYHASVWQSSGENWKNVKIRLSNGSPQLSSSKPELEPWYIDRPKSKTASSSNEPGMISGRVTDAGTGEELPFANVVALINNQTAGNAQTDLDGRFTIRSLQPGRYTLRSSFVGYQNAEMNDIKLESGKGMTVELKMQKGALDLQAVEIVQYKQPLLDKKNTTTGQTFTRDEMRQSTTAASSAGITMRGSRTGAVDYMIDGVKIRENENQFINFISNSIKSNVSNIEYDIEIPYSIKSDGSDHVIKIKEASVQADYVYHTVPKADPAVFLKADLINWNELNLLSGKAGIYFQGTYTGETFVEADITGDTLSLSLGRDKGLTVKREGKKELNDKKILGNIVRETSGWTITVRNNKPVSAKIIIEDQYPLSERKSIETSLVDAQGAESDSKTGKLTWKLNVEPNEKKSVSFSYSAKYPRYYNAAFE